MLIEKSDNNQSLKDIWADYRKKEVQVEINIVKDISEPEAKPETITKGETLYPAPDIKKVSSEVEKMGDRMVKVQFIEYIGKRKKKVTHIEVKEAELDDMISNSEKPVQIQYYLIQFINKDIINPIMEAMSVPIAKKDINLFLLIFLFNSGRAFVKVLTASFNFSKSSVAS